MVNTLMSALSCPDISDVVRWGAGIETLGLCTMPYVAVMEDPKAIGYWSAIGPFPRQSMCPIGIAYSIAAYLKFCISILDVSIPPPATRPAYNMQLIPLLQRQRPSCVSLNNALAWIAIALPQAVVCLAHAVRIMLLCTTVYGTCEVLADKSCHASSLLRMKY